MKNQILAAAVALAFATSVSYAQEPNPPSDHNAAATQSAPAAPSAPADQTQPAGAAAQMPRTHVDTTVVGDAVPAGTVASSSNGLESSHEFHPGAPELVSATKRLNLTARQEAQIHEAIERADAGAAVLIKHEQDLRQMVAATTPQDPLYAKLISEQAGNADRWNENREGLRQEVMGILTDQQRTKFEQTQAQR